MWEPEPEWPPDHTEIYPWCCVVDEDTRYGTPDDRMEVAQGFRKWFLGAIKDRFDGEETTAEPAPPPWDEGPEEIFRYIVEHSEPPKHLIRDVQRVEGWPHVARKLRETEQDWDMKLTEGNLRAQYCEHKPDPESQNNTQGEIGPEGYEERRKRERKKKERELGINGNVNDR